VNPFEDAIARAPRTPGVYFFLGAERDLLYVGKATDLRRRLGDHARDQSRTSDLRRSVLLDAVRSVHWEPWPDAAAAMLREADLIVMLKPAFNASHAEQNTDHYLVVDRDREHVSFGLTADGAGHGRVYGTFPHLAKGAFTPVAKQSKSGYGAFLRLAAANGAAVSPAALHDFLSGRSARVLDEMRAGLAEIDVPVFTRAALERDADAARAFFDLAPRRVREFRLRHALPPGLVRGEVMAELLADEVRATIGAFQPGVAARTEGALSPRAARHQQLRERTRG
jgi:hypothetical protein